MIILDLEETNLAKHIATNLRCKYSKVKIDHFPDTEHKITIQTNVKNQSVILVKSIFPANDSLIDLIFTASYCKTLGAKRIIMVCPYLGYMRQDKQFHKYEVVSAPIMAKLISTYADELITIDPHLHRIPKLSKIFSIKTKTLTAVDLIANHIKKNIKDGVIIGPDGESYQWDIAVAKITHFPFTILKKVRKSSYNIKITFNDKIDVKGKNVIIIDDVISTGRTLLKTINHVKSFKPKGIYCFATHGVLAGDAASKIVKTGAKLICTNTIPNKYDKIDISKLISDSIK
tara:strand:- start:148 stop:1011 length:864 start_codon:yes stop_codon:yes gene_type:complete